MSPLNHVRTGANELALVSSMAAHPFVNHSLTLQARLDARDQRHRSCAPLSSQSADGTGLGLRAPPATGSSAGNALSAPNAASKDGRGERPAPAASAWAISVASLSCPDRDP